MALGTFNWLDWLMLLFIIASLIVGYIQGMVRQVIGLIALYIAVVLAAQYYLPISDWLRAMMAQPTSRFLNAIVFFIIVVFVWLIISWLAFDAYRSTKLQMFPILDQIGGAILSLLTLFLSAILLLPVLSFAVSEPWPSVEAARETIVGGLQGSAFVMIFAALKPGLLNTISPWLPNGIPSIFNL